LGSFSILLCIGTGLVLIGVILLLVWRRRE
jgi:hypothetical protein